MLVNDLLHFKVIYIWMCLVLEKLVQIELRKKCEM